MANKELIENEVAAIRKKTVNQLRQLVGANSITTFSTEQLADLCKVQPATIRRALCTKGHFLGLVPQKLSNGRIVFSVKS